MAAATAFRFALLALLPPALAAAAADAQLRVAFTRDPSAVVVHWTSSNATDAPPYAPAAQWGLAPDALDRAAVNCSTDAYVAFAVRSPQLHFCVLAGLPASQAAVYYRVGDGSAAGWGAVRRFRTALAAGDATPFAFAVTGDMGIEYSAATMRQVAAAAAARDLRFFTLHNGDLAYADNRQTLFNGTIADGVLNDFYELVSDSYAAEVPTTFGIGNHELQLGSVSNCINGTTHCPGLAYLKRVAPTLPSSPSPFFYSFDHGLAHFVSISFENGWGQGSPQLSWLAADLAAVDRARTPWTVLYVHRPLYCSNTYSCNLTAPYLSLYEPLFFDASSGAVRVDLVLTSHVHCFERMTQVRNGVALANASSYDGMRSPLYLLQGAAGCLEGSTPWLPEAPAWSAVRMCESVAFGFSTVEVLNATHLRTSFVNAKDGGALDEVTISKA